MIRVAAKRSNDGQSARWLLSLLAIYGGATGMEAAEICGVIVQIIREWVMKFNALDPDELIDRDAPGQRPRLNDLHPVALPETIERGPTLAVHGVARWRRLDFKRVIRERFDVDFN